MITRRLTDGAFLVLGLAAVGVTYGYGNFVKYKIGPLFALEALFGLWFILAAAATILNPPKISTDHLKAFLPTLSFFIWGIALFLFDLAMHGSEIPDRRTMIRVAQHAVIFAYPLFWMGAGAWAALTNQRYCTWIALATLVASLTVENWAIGPIVAIPMVFCLIRAFQRKDPWCVFGFVALAGIAFYPLWFMWWRGLGIQRMTLGLLLFMMAAVPFLMSRTQRRGAVRSWGISLIVLISGFVAVSLYTSKPMGETIKESFQHVEDRPAEGEVFPVQLHARRAWWADTLGEWKKNPILGVGFIPELPVWLYKDAGMRNNWETAMAYDRLPGRSPVSGPHNSYLSVLARMGIIGLFLFFTIYASWSRAVAKWACNRKQSPLSLAELLIILIPINGALYALLNIGLEGPQNCMAMWLFAGIGMAWRRS